ncbi:hypothetical protein CHS0354_003034 [Potamilus streckersoni]|uniref:Uncharacterized protein n=1 Tax=Potamilus streckersoni TaxID=2493646 RepID=A0AAE0TBK5_9BIVA|nr:hypothetical protein CHS0354_003034 [Potamilus streckersoni]
MFKALTGAMYDQGLDVKVSIITTSTDGNKTLEINFSGFTSNLHYTTVMMYETRNISISRNYTGRIQNITSSQDTFSFLLLNVSFIDSGNFTVYEHSQEKGKTSIIVIKSSFKDSYVVARMLHVHFHNTMKDRRKDK